MATRNTQNIDTTGDNTSTPPTSQSSTATRTIMALPEEELNKRIADSMERVSSQLLRDLDKLVTSRVSAMANQLQEAQAANSSNQIEAIWAMKWMEKPSFRKKGNELQYKHNDQVMDHMESAVKAIEGSKYIQAKDKLVEGITMIKNRQKLIKLADMSKNGWKTVDEYVAHELASDDEDDKKIRKAEYRAGQKLKEQRRGKARAYKDHRLGSASRGTDETGDKGRHITKKSGVCYGCGEVGHWRYECRSKPAAEAGSAQKRSTGYYYFNENVNQNSNGDISENITLSCIFERESSVCIECNDVVIWEDDGVTLECKFIGTDIEGPDAYAATTTDTGSEKNDLLTDVGDGECKTEVEL
ncbi:uncharacterized protein [Ptychodera flava]|uniref:uncharacterized protein n=1 Tax=Ptychodera flava TaxID=63121 RepID=UPI003969D7C5